MLTLFRHSAFPSGFSQPHQLLFCM